MIDNFTFTEKYNIDDLINIIELLRMPGGCPWDAEQTHQTIKKNLIEETYEVIEAINKESAPMLREELGDVLWYVTAAAACKGYTLEDLYNYNVKKLEDRYGK